MDLSVKARWLYKVLMMEHIFDFLFQDNVPFLRVSSFISTFCPLCEIELWFCGIEWLEGLFWRDVSGWETKFLLQHHLLSLQFSPKLISPGPCPLACSVNKGLVLVRPLLYTQGGWSDHSSLLSAIQRQKPGQCLPQQTCGTAFTNFNWFKRRWTLSNLKYIIPFISSHDILKPAH